MKIIVRDNETRERLGQAGGNLVPRRGDFVRFGKTDYLVEAVLWDLGTGTVVLGVKKYELRS